LRFYIGRLSFDQLTPGRTAQLNAIPTRLVLPADAVDALTLAGRDSLLNSPVYKAFVGSL
jgi:NTE family protein